MKRRENSSEIKDISGIALPSWWSGASPTRVTQTLALCSCFSYFLLLLLRDRGEASYAFQVGKKHKIRGARPLEELVLFHVFEFSLR